VGIGCGQETEVTSTSHITTGGRRLMHSLVGSEVFVLVLCVLVFASFAPFTPGFATADNLGNILVACLPLLVLATGQTVVLITAGIDLSVTATIGLCSVLGALVMSSEHGWLRGSPLALPVGVAAMLATGGLIGFLNGACIAWLRMPAFMVTLTSMMFCGGLAVWLAKAVVNAESIYQLPSSFLVLGQHAWLAALLAVSAALIAHLVLARTLLGRWLYAVGHNPRASLVSGVPVAGVTISAYVLSGLLAAMASVLLTSRLETGSPNHGKALLLDVIGAAVIGGTSLFGGQGKVLWTVYGVLFLALLSNSLILLNLSDFLITIIKGVVILAAALLDVWRAKLARGS
jgi:ribose/xylose/arabinose/galactoside ABC-type transport system permease subunit